MPNKHSASRLAQLCKARETEYEGKYQNLASGTIIDTPGCQSSQERDIVKHICRSFAADVILVIGEDKLHSLLDSAFKVCAPQVYWCLHLVHHIIPIMDFCSHRGSMLISP